MVQDFFHPQYVEICWRNYSTILFQVQRHEIFVSYFFIAFQSTFVCMYVSIYLYLSIYIYLSMYLCIYVSMYVCMNVCLSVCLYVCLSVCMYVWMYVCLSVCMYVYIHICIYIIQWYKIIWKYILPTCGIDLSANFIGYSHFTTCLCGKLVWNHQWDQTHRTTPLENTCFGYQWIINRL